MDPEIKTGRRSVAFEPRQNPPPSGGQQASADGGTHSAPPALPGPLFPLRRGSQHVSPPPRSNARKSSTPKRSTTSRLLSSLSVRLLALLKVFYDLSFSDHVHLAANKFCSLRHFSWKLTTRCASVTAGLDIPRHHSRLRTWRKRRRFERRKYAWNAAGCLPRYGQEV